MPQHLLYSQNLKSHSPKPAPTQTSSTAGPAIDKTPQATTTTFEEVVAKPTDTAIVEATEALNKLRAEVEAEEAQAKARAKTETEERHEGVTGLENIEMGASRIQVDDKKIINCRADLNN